MRSFFRYQDLEFFALDPDNENEQTPNAIYFSLSAKESLEVDPFNQVALRLVENGVRVISVDLPFHGDNFLATKSLTYWAEEIASGNDPLTPFFNKASEAIDQMLKLGILKANALGLIGLSRGVMFALEIAARLPSIRLILGFAPLTQLKYTKEFREMTHNDVVCSHNVNHRISDLVYKKIRFYISNRDTRVGTKECFEFVHNLCVHAQEHGIRSPEVELFIRHPIGMQGHGTPKETFHDGADWLIKTWGLL